MTKNIVQMIMQAVSAGATKAHPKYLPEIAALHCQGKLVIVKADQNEIIVRSVTKR